MAVAARHITFRNVKFRWRATGTDWGISLTIWPEAGRSITCRFDYHHQKTPRENGVVLLTRQIVITNRIVRRVLIHAVEQHAYAPNGDGQLQLRDVDDFIDLSDAIRAD